MESYTPDWSSPEPPIANASSLNSIGYTVESDDYDYDFPTPTVKHPSVPNFNQDRVDDTPSMANEFGSHHLQNGAHQSSSLLIPDGVVLTNTSSAYTSLLLHLSRSSAEI